MSSFKVQEPIVLYCIRILFKQKTAYIIQSTDINQHAMPEKDTKG